MAKKKNSKPTALPPSEPRSRKAIAVCAAATLALLAADLGSKQWVESNLSAEPSVAPASPVCEQDEHGRVTYRRVITEPLVLIDGYLEFRYAENCGAAFGFMSSAPMTVRRILFGVAAVLASIALFVMFARGRGGNLFAWSVPLIVSGALGNLADRVRYGYVIDFIHFHLRDSWHYPTFNVADIGITVGVALLLLDGFRDARRARHEERADLPAARAEKPD